MNKKFAYTLGVTSGREAGIFGDFSAAELEELDRFLEIGWEICEHSRQYAGHPGYDFNREPNSEGLWDAFEQGEEVGLGKAWRERQRAKNLTRKAAAK